MDVRTALRREGHDEEEAAFLVHLHGERGASREGETLTVLSFLVVRVSVRPDSFRVSAGVVFLQCPRGVRPVHSSPDGFAVGLLFSCTSVRKVSHTVRVAVVTLKGTSPPSRFSQGSATSRANSREPQSPRLNDPLLFHRYSFCPRASTTTDQNVRTSCTSLETRADFA